VFGTAAFWGGGDPGVDDATESASSYVPGRKGSRVGGVS